jgi:hypothetical protein
MPNEQRREKRIQSHGHFHIFAGGAEPVAAKIVDVSPSGVSLEAPVELECGTVIRLHSHGLTAQGVVRHCSPRGDRYWIGVALSPPEGSALEDA